MNDPFKKGDAVRQKVTVLQGEIIAVQFDHHDSLFRYLVQVEVGDERWFDQENLERIEA